MRLTSDFWTSALLRRIRGEGGFAYLTRRGAQEAGAIYILFHGKDGLVDLYTPAPQSFYDEQQASDGRLFIKVLEHVAEERSVDYLEKELKFDPDIWLVEIEDYMPELMPFSIVKEDV